MRQIYIKYAPQRERGYVATLHHPTRNDLVQVVSHIRRYITALTHFDTTLPRLMLNVIDINPFVALRYLNVSSTLFESSTRYYDRAQDAFAHSAVPVFLASMDLQKYLNATSRAEASCFEAIEPQGSRLNAFSDFTETRLRPTPVQCCMGSGLHDVSQGNYRRIVDHAIESSSSVHMGKVTLNNGDILGVYFYIFWAYPGT